MSDPDKSTMTYPNKYNYWPLIKNTTDVDKILGLTLIEVKCLTDKMQ